MLKKIALAVVILIAAVLILAATKPDTMRIERSAQINAPAEKIFPLINNFSNWFEWSPYEKLDPAVKRTYSGPAEGKGAIYEWSGNDDVGEGRMEILETDEPNRILIKLDFLRPFEGHNTAEFTLKESGDSTKVTWAMQGPSPYMAKLMCLFMDMDKMIGKDFEAGLETLKKLTEE